ncbi:MAG: DUF4124 domain-containing protein [Variovorax sp.]
MRMIRIPLLALLAALAAAPATAQVHRCVDADGKVSFSDTVCNGARAHKVFGSNATSQGWTVEPYRAVPSAAPTQVASQAQKAAASRRAAQE